MPRTPFKDLPWVKVIPPGTLSPIAQGGHPVRELWHDGTLRGWVIDAPGGMVRLTPTHWLPEGAL